MNVTKIVAVNLTLEQLVLIRMCITIAVEDGSIFGGDEPGDPGWNERQALIDDVDRKLQKAVNKVQE